MVSQNTKKYDVIVIGSGIGGLTVGSLLSRSKKVLVLEKNDTFGGYCSTFKRGKFTFEASIHAINNCKKNHFAYNILKRCRVLNNIRFLQPKYLYRAIFPKHDFVVPQENIGSYIRTLMRFFPKESDGIKSVFRHMYEIHLEAERINRRKQLKKSPNLITSTNRSLKNMLDEYLISDELKAVISQYWLYCGLPPSKLSPIHFSYIAQDYMRNGSYCVEGGIKNIIDNLVKSIRKNNGKVYADHEVDKILIEKDKAIGVKTKVGKVFYGDYVISNIDAQYTFENLTEDNSRIKTCIKQMRQVSPSVSSCRVYLGLGIDIRKLGIFDYEIFLNPSYDLDKSFNALLENKIDTIPFGVCIHSNVDSTLCGKNKTVLSITALSNFDHWSTLDKCAYEKAKINTANALTKRVEKIIPNLSDYIEKLIVATPLTMLRYTGNNKGAAYGWSRNVFFYGSKYMNIQTPIKHLFLTSNWTKIGGGVEGVMRSAERTYDLIENNAW